MAKVTLFLAAKAKDIAAFLARPSTPNACRNCFFQLQRPAQGYMVCTLTGARYLNSRRPEKGLECPFPTPGGDEGWRNGTPWRSITNGVLLCPTCLNAMGLIGAERPTPVICPSCGGEEAEAPQENRP